MRVESVDLLKVEIGRRHQAADLAVVMGEAAEGRGETAVGRGRGCLIALFEGLPWLCVVGAQNFGCWFLCDGVLDHVLHHHFVDAFFSGFCQAFIMEIVCLIDHILEFT